VVLVKRRVPQASNGATVVRAGFEAIYAVALLRPGYLVLTESGPRPREVRLLPRE
jgi:hypothetical protein